MIRTIIQTQSPPFVWLDCLAPTPEELKELSTRYGLHPTSIHDCMDPAHLPKHEQIGDVTFVITRAFDPDSPPQATSLRQLTRKISLFIVERPERVLITVHRKELALIETTRAHWEKNTGSPTLPQSIVVEVLKETITSYDRPLAAAEALIEVFEQKLIRNRGAEEILGRIYSLRRRAVIMKRMLLHTLDAVQRLRPSSEGGAPLFQDLRETAQTTFNFADELLEDVDTLLNVHIALASHRTGEVMRVLTVFSVFFLPLTFIVGVYGMNFEHVPEFKWRYGYAMVWLVMGAVTGSLYFWFRRRGWLRRGDSL